MKQLSRDECVMIFNTPTGNKDTMTPNLLTEGKSCHVYKCDNDQINAGFSKVCEISKNHSIDSVKLFLHTSLIL